MENKKNDFCYIIILVILSISLIFSTLYVGSYLDNNVQIMNLVFSIISIICLIFSFIKKKEIKFNKLDVSVIILSFSSFIPIIFKTYSALQDTVEYLMWYMSVFNIYLIIKLLGIGKNIKILNLISNITIINSLIFILFGIDDMTFKLLSPIRESLGGIINYNSSSYRMDSLFEYPNAFSTCIGFSFIFAINYYLKSSKILKKTIYNYVSFIQIFAICLTGSRLTIIILCLTLLLYYILNFKDVKLKQIVFSLLYNILFSLLLSNKYLECLEYKMYEEAWLYILIFSLLNIFIYLFIYGVLIKYINTRIKIILKNKKVVYKCTLILLLVMLIIVFAILRTTAPIVLDKNSDIDEIKLTRNISNILPNTEYNFIFDINTYSDNENNKFLIFIKERDKNEFTISEQKIVLKNYNGKKEVNFVTSNDTKFLTIDFENDNLGKQVKIVINSLEINGKEIDLNYKYLPASLVNRFTKEIKDTKSTWLRFYYIKDALKLIKENILFGYGGNGWDYNYESIKSYNYISRDVHSHPMQIFIQNGLIGFLSYLFILYYLIKIVVILYKRKIKIDNNIYIFSVLFIIIHSFLDFDMSFFYNLIMTFMYIAILSNIYNENLKFNIKIKINKKIIYSILALIEIFILVTNTRIYIAKFMFKKIEKTTQNKIQNLAKIVDLDPYNMEYRRMYINEYTTNFNGSYEFSVKDYDIIYENLKIYFNNTKNSMIFIEPYIANLNKFCQNINSENVYEYTQIINRLLEILELYNVKLTRKYEIDYNNIYNTLSKNSIDFNNKQFDQVLKKVYSLLNN